jgi:hypothetical protein
MVDFCPMAQIKCQRSVDLLERERREIIGDGFGTLSFQISAHHRIERNSAADDAPASFSGIPVIRILVDPTSFWLIPPLQAIYPF